MTPLALGTAAALGALARGAQRPFPGALPGALVAALLIGAVAWLWFRALRRAGASVPGAAPSAGRDACSALPAPGSRN